MGGGRSTYIPPHMRGVAPPAVDGPPPPMMNGNAPEGAWNGARLDENFPKPDLARHLIRRLAMTSATAPALHTNGLVHQILPPERTVLLQHHSILAPGTRPLAIIELLTPTYTVKQAAPIPLEDLLVGPVTDSGVMGNTSQVLPTLVSNASCLAFPMIHQSCRQASIFRTTTTSLWKHRVTMFQIPFFNSLTHRLTTISYPTSNWQAILHQRPSRSIRSLLSWEVAI